MGDTVGGQFLAQNVGIKVLKGAPVILAGTNVRTDDFDTAVWRIVDSLALFSVIVTDSVSILLFKLLKERLIFFQSNKNWKVRNLVNVQAFSELISPEFQGMFQAHADAFDKQAVLDSPAVLQVVSGAQRLVEMPHTERE